MIRIICIYRDFKTVVKFVKREMKLLNNYFKVYKLSLNVEETIIMIFNSARTKYDADVVNNIILLHV